MPPRRRSRSGARRLLAAAALAPTLLLATPAPGALAAAAARPAGTSDLGSIGLRLVDAPSDSSQDPRARIYIIDHVAPGTVLSRRVEVSNTSAGAARIALYSAAASIDHGQFLGADAHTPNDLSSWTRVSPASLTVPPGGRSTATVTITVPSQATAGEQYGVVWAEARSTPDAGGGVTQVSRVGIRLYLSVGPGGAPPAAFTITSLTAARSTDGRPELLAAVHNTGLRALDLGGTVRLTDGPTALSAGPFPATLGVTLAIGDTRSVQVLLDPALPAGPWQAQITLRSGLLERTAQARVLFPAVGQAAPVRASAVRPDRRPLQLGLGALAVLALLLFLLILRRRRQRPTRAGAARTRPAGAGRPAPAAPTGASAQ